MTNRRNSKSFTLAVLAYIVVSFVVQALSHFVINAEHYAAVSFMREDPVFSLGILSMVIQGALLAYIYPLFYDGGSPVREGLKFGIMAGVFLVSYIALVPPAKYPVPSVAAWIAVESIVGLVQFSLVGVLVGLVYGENKECPATLRSDPAGLTR